MALVDWRAEPEIPRELVNEKLLKGEIGGCLVMLLRLKREEIVIQQALDSWFSDIIIAFDGMAQEIEEKLEVPDFRQAHRLRLELAAVRQAKAEYLEEANSNWFRRLLEAAVTPPPV